MNLQKRSFRWALFGVAVFCFFYTIFIHVSIWSVAVFFASGGAWYWLEKRKARELDAFRPGESKEPDGRD